MASLFPPTFHNRANGLRVDLMQKIADTKPGFFRVPGGNYLEGNTLDTRFEWKKTIGPIEQRPGHFNSAWGYWSQDGLGLLEYLQMAEDLGAEPLLAVNAGYALNGTVVPPAALGGYVQDALDEIEYAIGDPSTPWGARRAADGHPAPYNVRYVEIGNEDQFDRSGSYPQRYAAFYDAIKAAHPDLKLVATIRVTNRPMDVVDDHYYNSDPGFFAGAASTYDNTGRSGPKVMVGEFASTQGSTTGTLAAALGEAAFMTGLVRNADVVIGASYAPLLVNENAPNWPTNLIGYDAERSYGSPSYYVQKLFGANLGDHVTPTELVAGNGSLYTVATRGAAGIAYLTVVNRGASASVDVDLNGANASGGTVTVLSGDPAAQNSLAKPTAVSPASHRLGRLGGAFRYTFAANSLTVLALNTGG
jgi:alpha-L-arabinofuranosidase